MTPPAAITNGNIRNRIMFNVMLTAGPRIDVKGRAHTISYATGGSLPNPLEATYAAIASRGDQIECEVR